MQGRMARWLAAAGLVALASAAPAQAAVVQGAVGQGLVRADDGRIGDFQFRVEKVLASQNGQDLVRVKGQGAFRLVAPDHAVVEITCKNVRQFVIGDDKKSAEFAGPALMVVRTPQGVRRVQGVLGWRVADRGRPGPMNPPDLVGVHFTPAEGGQPFEFGGVVIRGDVRVFEVTESAP